MPSRYDPQLGELIKSMLCKRPEDRPDVKLILRQPYIKRQIAMFLEATKEYVALTACLVVISYFIKAIYLLGKKIPSVCLLSFLFLYI